MASNVTGLGKEARDAAGCFVAVSIVLPELLALYDACKARCLEQPGSLTEIREIVSALEARLEPKHHVPERGDRERP